MSTKEQRRLLKAFWREVDRVEALRQRILIEDADSDRRAAHFCMHGVWPPRPPLPDLPEIPPQCIDMTCGGKGRRSGEPCKSREIFRNGRCKWHGGASTGPKTTEGSERSRTNLRRGSKL